MPMPTDAEIARFREDGAICLRNAIPMEWIERMRAAVDDDMANPGPMVRINTPKGAPGLFFVDFQLWQRHAAARSPSSTSRRRVKLRRSSWARTRSSIITTISLAKEPGTQERTPWHHDQPYYPIDGEQVVSLWMPLDPVDRETCVEYVKGLASLGPLVPAEVLQAGRRRACRCRTAASSRCPTSMPNATIMSSSLGTWRRATSSPFTRLRFHGASGNRSTSRRRRAWATRWCGDDARYGARAGQIHHPSKDTG